MVSKISDWVYLFVFIGLFILWFLFLYDGSVDFYHVSEWGWCFLVIPITYCIASIIGENALKKTLFVLLGVIISILLARNIEFRIALTQIIAALLGGVTSWCMSKIK